MTSRVEKIEDVQLDSLVLTRIASQLPLLTRIQHETVCYRFADCLRNVDQFQRISLAIEQAKVENENGSLAKCQKLSQYILILSTRKRTERDVVKIDRQILVHGDQLSKRLMAIFQRFKRFFCLKFRDDPTEQVYSTIVRLFSSNECCLIELRKLKFKLYYTQPDHRIIDHFALLLRELRLKCMLPYDEALSVLIWSSVAGCSNLRKLYYSPQNGLPTATPKDPFSNKLMSRCLQRISIWYFKGDMLNESYNDEWLYESFSVNNSMRYLFINNPKSLSRMLHSAKALRIVSKLRTLKVNSGYSDKLAEQQQLFYNILCALPKTGRLEIVTVIKCPIISRIGCLPYSADAIEEVSKTLTFWLKLSSLTERRIVLHLTFANGLNAITACTPLEKLLIVKNFVGISSETHSGRAILRFKYVRVDVCLSDCGCIKSSLTA